jgi:hypothetical protein
MGISGMKGNEEHWGGGISIISQNFSKSPSILFHPLESSISQTSRINKFYPFGILPTLQASGSQCSPI